MMMLILAIGIYAASKAGVNILSEILRLELEPLNVKVITIVAGIIESSFHVNLNSDSFSLPENSEYKSMEELIRGMMRGKGKSGEASTAEEFAEEVVRDVLRGKTGKTYSGALGWSGKWLFWWWPDWLFVSFLRIRGDRRD
jgi:1-acylglycerone phosphate reductase